MHDGDQRGGPHGGGNQGVGGRGGQQGEPRRCVGGLGLGTRGVSQRTGDGGKASRPDAAVRALASLYSVDPHRCAFGGAAGTLTTSTNQLTSPALSFRDAGGREEGVGDTCARRNAGHFGIDDCSAAFLFGIVSPCAQEKAVVEPEGQTRKESDMHNVEEMPSAREGFAAAGSEEPCRFPTVEGSQGYSGLVLPPPSAKRFPPPSPHADTAGTG